MTAAASLSPAPGSRPSAVAAVSARIASLDAFRGFVMFLMLAEAMRLWTLSEAFPASRFWAFVAYNTTHVPWQGCSLHDLIQPAFSFLAGASLPFSIASRQGKGESFGRMFAHAVWRSLILILLGIFLRSLESPHTYWTFEDTLTQIGLGYSFLFLLAFASLRVQVAAFTAILVGFWAAFVLYPLPGPGFDYSQVGVPAGLAAPLHRLPRALQQELEPRVGVRRLVPQPVPARGAIPFQRRRLVHAELHSDAGDDDARVVGGSWLKTSRSIVEKLKGLVIGGVALDACRPAAPVAAHQPDREADLDLVVHAVQRWPGPPDARGFLRADRVEGVEALVVPAVGDWRQLDRHLRHELDDRALRVGRPGATSRRGAVRRSSARRSSPCCGAPPS